MADPLLLQSIDRLERAVALLESNLAAMAPLDRSEPKDLHLRAEVRAVIDELDRMIVVRHG